MFYVKNPQITEESTEVVSTTFGFADFFIVATHLLETGRITLMVDCKVGELTPGDTASKEKGWHWGSALSCADKSSS